MIEVNGIEDWITFTCWAVLILIAILITRYFVQRNKHPNEKSTLNILKEKFETGEIDKEEYDEKKKHL